MEKTKPISLRLDKELLRRLNEYADSHEFPPTLTVLLETAIREMLERRADAKRDKGKRQ